MTLTPEQIDALPNYSWSQLAKLWRNVLAELGSNPESQVVGPDNHTYTFQDVDKVQRIIAFCEQRAAGELAAAGGNDADLNAVAVRFVEGT